MLNERIKKIRKDKSMTLKTFATALGTSPGFVSEIENGLKMPGYELLLSLKRIYDVDLNWLLTGEEQAEGSNDKVDQRPMDTVTEKINQHLGQMCEDQKRDVLKYTEEKKLLSELMSERQLKTG